MVSQQEDTRIDDFAVRENKLYRNATEFACFPTAIAELARLGGRVFVVLSVPDDSGDPAYSGTNLWALDLNGRVLWKAPNLNEPKALESRGYALCYRGLSIFDRNSPKLRAHADDRFYPALQSETGQYVKVYPDLNWSNYAEAWARLTEIEKEISEATFARAVQLRPTCPDTPLPVETVRNPASPLS